LTGYLSHGMAAIIVKRLEHIFIVFHQIEYCLEYVAFIYFTAVVLMTGRMLPIVKCFISVCDIFAYIK
jgi:hypothetical protein